MEVILNIGLNCNNDKNIGAGTVLRELEQSGFQVKRYAVIHSDTEPTVVALVEDGDRPGLDNRVDMLSNLLSQDCIAVYDPLAGEGSLIGPRAEAWGEFDPTFFFMIDGSRLTALHQVAA